MKVCDAGATKKKKGRGAEAACGRAACAVLCYQVCIVRSLADDVMTDV